MSQRNKDLPAMPVHPMQDKFGQVILMAGMSKLEITALNILTAYLINNDKNLGDEYMEALISLSYDYAEIFCAYLENKGEKESSIII
jgi:hypothetical protein